MWKIAAAGIAFTLLAACLKQIKEEYRTYLMLAAGLFFGYYLLEQIRYLIQSMNQLRQYLSIDNIYMESILKMIGIIGAIIGVLVTAAAIYYLVKDKDDNESRKIYSVMTAVGILILRTN